MDHAPGQHDHGAGWDHPGHVDWYLGRVEGLKPRLAGEEVLREILPAEPRSALDLGCGDGRLTSLVLAARPTVVRAVAVDNSLPMLDRARERFAADDRVTVAAWDLAEDLSLLGAFDVIVSGFAIHHLVDARKATLTAEVAGQLRPGGVFANLEIVASATGALHREFLAAIGREADDAEDRPVDVETQLGWMRQAGLADVDCLWRWRGMALLAGRRPAN